MAEPFLLLVDDNPETRDFLARALEAEGFHVRSTKSVFKPWNSCTTGRRRPR